MAALMAPRIHLDTINECVVTLFTWFSFFEFGRVSTRRSELSRTPSTSSEIKEGSKPTESKQSFEEMAQENSDGAQEEDEEEIFTYPQENSEDDGQVNESLNVDEMGHHPENLDAEEEFNYPDEPLNILEESSTEAGPSTHVTQTIHPSPAQLEALYSAGLSGDVGLLQALIKSATASGEISSFSLVNDASSRTGLTVVHAASSRGRLEALKWCRFNSLSLYIHLSTVFQSVIEECGAIPDLEDKEGEVCHAFLKQSLYTHWRTDRYA